MTPDTPTPSGETLRRHFEANMLDGDAIQAGQMLSSESVFEYITELIAAEVTASKLQEIKNLYLYVANLPGRSPKSVVLDYLNARERDLRKKLGDNQLTSDRTVGREEQ